MRGCDIAEKKVMQQEMDKGFNYSANNKRSQYFSDPRYIKKNCVLIAKSFIVQHYRQSFFMSLLTERFRKNKFEKGMFTDY